MTRRLSPADLADILRDTTHAQAKPPRTTAGDVLVLVLKALAAGVGAAMLIGGGLWLLGAPTEIVGNSAATTAVIVAGTVLLVQAVPSDKLLTVRRIQKVQAVVIDAEFRKRQAYQAIEQLEERIDELQRALDRMTQERDNAVLEKKRAVDQLRSATEKTFVRASNTESQVVGDAHELLRHWFGSNETKWFSRAVANEFGWSDKRHKAAQQLLVDSGVVVVNEKRPRVLVRPLNAAIRAVNDHVAKVESVYATAAPRPNWDMEEE